MRNFITIFISVIFAINIVNSQELTYKNYSTNDGLLSSSINSIYQDKNGYIWFGTKYGVSVFNGYVFKNLTVTEGLVYNNIIDIYQDDEGKIWFLSSDFNLVYLKNDSIFEYKYNNLIQKELLNDSKYVRNSFVVIENKVKFAIEKRGLFIISNSGKVKLFYNDEIILKRLVVAKNTRGLFAIRSMFNNDSLMYANNCNFIKPKFIYKSDLACTPDVKITEFNDYTFLANTKQIITFKNGDVINKLNINDNIIYIKITNNNLWVATKNKGVFIYDISKNGVPVFRNKVLGNMQVNSIIVDREGGYWIATERKGVYYIPELFIYVYKLIDDYSNTILTDIVFYKDELYAATSSGTLINVTKNKEIKISENINSGQMKLSVSTERLIASYNNILYGIEDNIAIEIFNVIQESHPYFNIKTIDVRLNKILIAGDGGFIILEDDKIKQVINPDKRHRLSINKTYRLPNKTLLIASDNGLIKYQNRDLYNYSNKKLLMNISINDISADENADNIFVATAGYGLLCLREDTIISYMDKGLSSNIILSVCYKDSLMGVSSNRGIDLVKFNESMELNIVQKYNKQYGLLSNEIKKIICVDSSIYAMSDKGISRIKIETNKNTSIKPYVFIKKIIINGKDTLKHNNCRLDNNQNHIIFEFIGLSYKNAGNINYKYKLMGSKSDWIVSKSIKAEYPFLPTGKYKFIVYASNEDGKWSELPDYFEFEVLPPIWKTWWFITGFASLILLLILLILRLIVVNVKRKEKLQKDLLMYRDQAFRKQMNPHFIFNALNSIQHFILQNDKRMSNKYLNKFSSLMRLVLENSQKNLITIEQELTALQLYLDIESIRFKDKFAYNITIDKNIEVGIYKIPPLILQPYVENAIWHGLMNIEKEKIGRLNVDIKLIDNFIYCYIIDNGIGREKSSQLISNKNKSHESLGTKINQNRVETFNYANDSKISIRYEDIQDDAGTVTGTKVIIVLPLLTD